ncbi:hypothetical protein QP028_09805 [Corynebacterium suedekumii]|nr:hypothetical protein QP028_09805 [Corynebacterium suedekumii]
MTTNTARRRIIALDVLRGIAILGTLLTNIWIFSQSAWDDDGDRAQGALAVFNRVADVGLNLFTDGKFIGLLTIMFGIGLEIQRQSAIRRGEPWPGRYPWRALVLILNGLLNYIFIFEFDVLMGYGLTGLVVAAVMATSPKTQKIWMVIGIGAHLLMIGVFTALPRLVGESDLPADQPVPADANRLDAALGASGTESYWGMVGERLQTFIGGRGEIPIMFVMGLGLFLVGAHLYRADFSCRRAGVCAGSSWPSASASGSRWTGRCGCPTTAAASSPATSPPRSSPSVSSPPSPPSTPTATGSASSVTASPWSAGWP